MPGPRQTSQSLTHQLERECVFVCVSVCVKDSETERPGKHNDLPETRTDPGIEMILSLFLLTDLVQSLSLTHVPDILQSKLSPLLATH